LKHGCLYPMLPLLMLVILAAPMVAGAQGLLVEDDVETGTYVDLEGFKVSDNGTHLIITAGWAAPLPSGSPVNYTLERSLFLFLDLDNNRKTGCCRGYPYGGWEVEVEAYRSADGGEGLYLWFFNSTGFYEGMEAHAEWLSANSSGVEVSIPLAALNLSRRDTVLIQGVNGRVAATDTLSHNYFANWTVPYANISVDGDPGDWAGIDPLAVDSDDGLWDPYQVFNLTGVYVATDNKALFIRLDLGGRFNASLLPGLDYSTSFSLDVDVDNDGSVDYEVYLGSHPGVSAYTYVYNVSGHSWMWYRASSPVYNESWVNSSVEAGLSLSAIGLDEGLPGGNLTIRLGGYNSYIRDFLLQPWAALWHTRVFYTVGLGGYDAVPVDQANGGYYNALFTVQVSGAEFNASASGYLYVYLAAYDAEPTGNTSLQSSYRASSYYYVIHLSNPNSTVWPIHVEINVSGTATPILLYYDASSGIYKPLGEQSYDPATGTLKANLTQDEYQAGDDPVLVAAVNATPVGGALSLPKPAATQPLIPAAATTLLLATILAAYKHRKH